MKFALLRSRSSQWIIAGMCFIGIWGLAACQPIQPVASEIGDAAQSQIPEVTVEVNDGDFSIPEDFPGGIVAVTVQNNTSTPLDVGFTRLHEGTSLAELEELAQDFMGNLVPLLQKASFMVSFNPVLPGESRQAIIDFKTGHFLVDATEHTEAEPIPGAAHIFSEFTADELVGTVEPQADVTVEMEDFAFVMPDEIEAGERLWEFVNQGEQWHMALLLKPNPDVSMDEVMAALMAEGEPAGPPPFEFVGDVGVPPISQGERVWLRFGLQPGEYLVVCPIPDVAAMMAGQEPMAHLQHGMHRVLTVK